MAKQTSNNTGSGGGRDIKASSFVKGLNKDVADIFMPETIWTNAVNAINNSHQGETGTLSNEPANYLADSAPYTIIGYAHKEEGRWVIFSTNNGASEIGIFDEVTETYQSVVNAPCLAFKKTNLITAVCKSNYDCTHSVYFSDGLNPDRVLNLDRVPYLTTGNNLSEDLDCFIPEYTTILDCDAIRLHPFVDQPCITVRKASGAGQMINGSYMVCVAYSENGIRLTDYSTPSQPQALWTHEGIGGSLDITIDNLDQSFEEYELVLIATVSQQTLAKKVGNYSIRQSRVTLDQANQSLETVPLAYIPLRNVVYEKSDKMHKVGDYLIRTGVTTQPYFNYQPLANNITTRWVAAERNTDYYYQGGNSTGYLRDEVYSFFIRWVYRTGARSASFHIPGRPAIATDLTPEDGDDVVYPTETQRWQVYDTSTKAPASFETLDGAPIAFTGEMAYWQSTETYPDDKPEIWGDLCGKPIRHHKMPSNETMHIHNQGGSKIYVLGVQFANIAHPVDENGIPLSDVVGYEILRGSREGNRSIVAKGLFNNMWEYDIQGSTSKKGLFQNFPYNDLRPNKFLTTDYGTLLDGTGSTNRIEDAPALTTYKRNYFSFHSPETSFIKPYLGDGYVKVYTEERGIVTGNFEVPFKHPKHKVLRDTAFGMAIFIGAGIAALSSIGTVRSTGGQYSLVAGTGTFQFSSQREAGPSSAVGDLITDGIQQTASLGGIGSTLSAGIAAGVMVGQAVYWMGLGIDQVMGIFYKIAKFRDYILQYNSHGFYGNYTNVTNGDVPSGVAHSFRRLIANDGAKYMGAALHDMDAAYRVNNLNRNKFVALKLTADLADPLSITDNSRARVRDAVPHTKPDVFRSFNTRTVAYYGAIKLDYQNQYGQLQSIVQIPTDSCVYSTLPDATVSFASGFVFGGDVYINRFTEKNPYAFFNTWLMGEPDGQEFNYANYVNGPAPRYWADLSQYDITDFSLNFELDPWPRIDPYMPSDMHRMDRGSGLGAFALRNAWFYLFVNGVRDFFTESELNMAYRDYGEEDFKKFYDVYGNSFNDLSTMFRADLIKLPTYYKYDTSLSHSQLFNNFATWGSVLPRDYDPELYNTCFEYYPKRAVYSLPQRSGMKRDNWRNYLPLNYKDFKGTISTIKSLNAQGAVILFEDAEPVQFLGVDTLQTTGGTKVTIGDGGLFQQNMQSLVNADDSLEYGTTRASRSAVNTPYGMFYISQKTGKILHFAGGSLDEISRSGLKFWFNENLPSKMLQAYPNFPMYDNPVAGIGCQAIYDQQYELLYFSKKDYVPKRMDLLFDNPNGVPYYLCGSTPPAPITPQDPIVTAGAAFGTPPSSCLLDIIVAIDSSGSTGPILIPTSVAAAERNVALALITNPTIAAGMAAGAIQVGFTSWSGATQQQSMNPNGFSMSNTVTAAQVSAWYNTHWYANTTQVENGLIHAQTIMDDKAGSQLGDRSSDPTFRQIIVFITDTVDEAGAVAGVGDPYQSSTIPANTIGTPAGPANQFVYACFAAQNTDIPPTPLYLQRISATDGAVNAPGGYNYGINASIPASIDQVADAIAAATCAPEVSCELIANTTSVTEGEQVLLMWSSVDGNTATLNGESVPVNGNAIVLPLDPVTTYTLVITAKDGSTSICTISIDVAARPDIPTKCPCAFDDLNCFTPCNWTVSYDPKSKTWVSFHDWAPDLTMPAYNHFFTTKGSGIWKHNTKWDLFTEYYGKPHGWEVEFPVITSSGVTTLSSVEFWMEAYKYYNDGKDFNHVLDESFDTAVIYNSEQNSGILKLNVKPKNDPLALIAQPVATTYNMQILLAKEENKYRFNQFWDNTDDRGEFSFDQTPMWITGCNGYQKTVNPEYINYNKPPLQRKKFRHYGNRVILRKTTPTDKKMVLKVGLTKTINSPR
jgi:hypothetical protein